MGAFEQLITYISSIVKANNNEEITGTNMQSVLLNMVGELGLRQFRGVATINTNPGLPTGQAIYVASQPGIYQYFNLEVYDDELVLFIWEPELVYWRKEVVIKFPDSFSGESYIEITGQAGYITPTQHKLGSVLQVDFFKSTNGILEPYEIFYQVYPDGTIEWQSNSVIDSGVAIIK